MRLMIAGLIAVIVFGVVTAIRQQEQLDRLGREVVFAEEGVRQLRFAIEDAEEYRNRLRACEPEVIERLAREQLGWTIPGEVVIRLVTVDQRW